MATLNRRLNKLLNTKHLLYVEYTTNPPVCNLINTLNEAIDTNYKFTLKQIYTFMEQANDNNDLNTFFLDSNKDEHKKIVKYIFTTHDMRETNLINICESLYNLEIDKYFFIDYLFEKKYDFTNDFLKYLFDGGYTFYNIDCYTEFHKNIIFIAYVSILYNYNDKFQKCIELIKPNNGNNSDEHFSLVYKLINSNYNSANVDYGSLVLLLDNIFLNCTDDEIIKNTKNKYSVCSIIIKYMANKIKYSDILIKFLVESFHGLKYIMQLLNDGNKLTIEQIHICLLRRDSLALKNPELYEKLNLEINKENCRHEYYYYDLTLLLKICDLQPNMTTLNIACDKGYLECAKTLINDYNIYPTKETLDLAAISSNYELIQMILNYKIIPDDKTFYNVECYESDIWINIIELLISYGFAITFNHITHLISNKQKLTNLSRFDINYDEKLYFVCFVSDYYPQEYINFVDSKRLELYSLCSNKKLKYEILIDFLKNNNIGLDLYALNHIIINDRDSGQYIMGKYNIVPSLITTFKTSQAPKNMIWDIIRKYNITENDMLKQHVIS